MRSGVDVREADVVRGGRAKVERGVRMRALEWKETAAGWGRVRKVYT